MLRIYQDAVAMCGEAAVVAKVIERCDRDLARELRRAATSVVLNLAEGAGTTGGHRRQRYLTAMGSAREVVGCFDAAEAMQYVGRMDRKRLDVIIGTLVRVVRP
jgi:four helix bundle protein